MSSPFEPKAADDYRHLSIGGQVTIEVSAYQACVIFKAYDYGAGTLSTSEREALAQIIAHIKAELWP